MDTFSLNKTMLRVRLFTKSRGRFGGLIGRQGPVLCIFYLKVYANTAQITTDLLINIDRVVDQIIAAFFFTYNGNGCTSK